MIRYMDFLILYKPNNAFLILTSCFSILKAFKTILSKMIRS